MAQSKERKITILPADYGINNEEGDEETGVESAEVITAEEWLSDEVEMPEDWFYLKRFNKKVKIRGITEEERKKIRSRAPMTFDKKTHKKQRDEDWVMLEMVRLAIVEPKIPDARMLEKALSGEVATIAKKISELSGFEIEDLISGALG